MITLRVFEVTPSSDKPIALSALTVEGEGDAAKKAAKAKLESQGWVVRGVSWSPGTLPGAPNTLLAYVMKRS